MTNPTPPGPVPEALRIADEFRDCIECDAIPSIIDIEKAEAELRRLHAENERLQQELIRESHRTAEQKLRADQVTRQHADQAAMNREARAKLAALVEAQQPAAHVQNPAEIAHVAGDVSKNGAKSNVSAQQAAPSAAAQIDSALNDYAQAFVARVNGWTKQNGDDLPVARAALFQAITDYARELAMAAPQTSPTPQADSQPAPVGGAAELLKEILAAACCEESETNLTSDQYRKLYDLHSRIQAMSTPPAQAAESVLEDAARYRWLRDTSNADDPSHMIALHIRGEQNDTSLSGIDAAIDAAMAAQRGGA